MNRISGNFNRYTRIPYLSDRLVLSSQRVFPRPSTTIRSASARYTEFNGIRVTYGKNELPRLRSLYRIVLMRGFERLAKQKQVEGLNLDLEKVLEHFGLVPADATTFHELCQRTSLSLDLETGNISGTPLTPYENSFRISCSNEALPLPLSFIDDFILNHLFIVKFVGNFRRVGQFFKISGHDLDENFGRHGFDLSLPTSIQGFNEKKHLPPGIFENVSAEDTTALIAATRRVLARFHRVLSLNDRNKFHVSRAWMDEKIQPAFDHAFDLEVFSLPEAAALPPLQRQRLLIACWCYFQNNFVLSVSVRKMDPRTPLPTFLRATLRARLGMFSDALPIPVYFGKDRDLDSTDDAQDHCVISQYGLWAFFLYLPTSECLPAIYGNEQIDALFSRTLPIAAREEMAKQAIDLMFRKNAFSFDEERIRQNVRAKCLKTGSDTAAPTRAIWTEIHRVMLLLRGLSQSPTIDVWFAGHRKQEEFRTQVRRTVQRFFDQFPEKGDFQDLQETENFYVEFVSTLRTLCETHAQLFNRFADDLSPGSGVDGSDLRLTRLRHYLYDLLYHTENVPPEDGAPGVRLLGKWPSEVRLRKDEVTCATLVVPYTNDEDWKQVPKRAQRILVTDGPRNRHDDQTFSALRDCMLGWRADLSKDSFEEICLRIQVGILHQRFWIIANPIPEKSPQVALLNVENDTFFRGGQLITPLGKMNDVARGVLLRLGVPKDHLIELSSTEEDDMKKRRRVHGISINQQVQELWISKRKNGKP